MDFSAFDTKKMDEYAAEAKKAWGNTPAYREYEQKAKGRSKEETAEVNRKMMEIFTEFGAIRQEDPASEKAQALVRKLQNFISAHFLYLHGSDPFRFGSVVCRRRRDDFKYRQLWR